MPPGAVAEAVVLEEGAGGAATVGAPGGPAATACVDLPLGEDASRAAVPGRVRPVLREGTRMPWSWAGAAVQCCIGLRLPDRGGVIARGPVLREGARSRVTQAGAEAGTGLLVLHVCAGAARVRCLRGH